MQALKSVDHIPGQEFLDVCACAHTLRVQDHTSGLAVGHWVKSSGMRRVCVKTDSPHPYLAVTEERPFLLPLTDMLCLERLCPDNKRLSEEPSVIFNFSKLGSIVLIIPQRLAGRLCSGLPGIWRRTCERS